MKKVRVAKGSDEREVPLEQSLVVGRDPSCGIVDTDPELSRRHAEFVVKGRDVIVRDLNSRNGISVNGARVSEAVLRSGDVVQAARLRMKYLDEAEEDETQNLAEQPAERTVVMPPPVAPRKTPPAPAAPVGAAASPSAAAPPAPPVPSDSDDKTMLLPSRPGPQAPAGPTPKTATPPAPAPAVATPHTAPKPAAAQGEPAKSPGETAAPAPKPAQKRTGSWGGRVFIQTLVLAILAFVVTWLPMSILQQRLLNETALARATALAHWLASEAAASLAAQRKGLSDVGAQVGKEPGVSAYLVVTPGGKVLAPAARTQLPVAKLPGLGVAPSEIFSLRSSWDGDRLEVALPVAVGDDPRAAVAALTFSPAASTGSSGILVVPILLATLVLGWLVAMAIRRRTLRAIARFNEDVDLLLAGQLASVPDPMGTKPTKELADLVNHLVSRLRAGEASAAGRTAVDAPPEPPRAPAPLAEPRASAPVISRAPEAPRASAEKAPAPRAAVGECQVVASPAFRIVEASAGCSDILGVRPEALVGQHVLDAITDRAILDAILKCLSKLPPAGEERVTVAPEGRPFRLSITVERTGKDQPITIAMKPIDGERA